MDSMLEDVILSALLKFDGYPDAMALPRDQRNRYQVRAKAVSDAVESHDATTNLALLTERDKFIVGQGLWEDFVESLR